MSDMLELDDKVHALQMDMELARRGAEMGEELAEELARNRAQMAARAHVFGTLFSALFSSMSFLIVVSCISLFSVSLAVCSTFSVMLFFYIYTHAMHLCTTPHVCCRVIRCIIIWCVPT